MKRKSKWMNIKMARLQLICWYCSALAGSKMRTNDLIVYTSFMTGYGFEMKVSFPLNKQCREFSAFCLNQQGTLVSLLNSNIEITSIRCIILDKKDSFKQNYSLFPLFFSYRQTKNCILSITL